MRNIICFLFGHKSPTKINPISTKLICIRCNHKFTKVPKTKSGKPVVRYCIREQKKNHFIAACNISDLTATGVSYQQAHKKFLVVLENHFNLDINSEIRLIRDMKIK